MSFLSQFRRALSRDTPAYIGRHRAPVARPPADFSDPPLTHYFAHFFAPAAPGVAECCGTPVLDLPEGDRVSSSYAEVDCPGSRLC